MKRHQNREITPTERPFLCEAEVIPGLEALAAQEIFVKLKQSARLSPESEQVPGAVRFRYRGDLKQLEQLRLSQSIYLIVYFDVPRPKALLGNQEFRVVINKINTIRTLYPKSTFKTLHIAAAGSETIVMQRLRQEIEKATALEADKDAGDLLLRLRRGFNSQGWELLIRIGNRPLATRSWRVCNFEGALNATVAHAMTLLSEPTEKDNVINLASGSGSLLIERAIWGKPDSLIGVDEDSFALRCANTNIKAAGIKSQQIQGDIKKLPLKDRVANVLLADLPFGQLTGSHSENAVLYPASLTEADRIAVPKARLVLITHEIRLMQSVLAATRVWKLEKEIRITLRGLHPRIYVLRKQD